MALFVIFVLGVANFALHRAVLESRHPLVNHIPWQSNRAGGWMSLGIEFIMLLVAMEMSARGSEGWVWAYGMYTLANGSGAWLILNGKV